MQELLNSNYKVYAQVHSNPKALDAIRSAGDLEIVQQELSNPCQVQQLIESISSQEKRVEALVNTVGPMKIKNLLELTPEEWQEQIHLNLNLAFYLFHFAKDLLICSKGHLINFTFSGVDSLTARPDSASFCAAKTGLVVLTKSLATSMAKYRVRVNAVSPGLIEANAFIPLERREMAAKIPFGRPGTPEEVASVVSWLLNSSPEYITGSLIPISGAWEFV
jgi:NAD(P)-dependent dehydrogenase (short-subunit alcohol dehydrogenase family)